MTDSRLACRFKASWTEGDRPVRESFHRAVTAAAETGTEPPNPPAEVLRMARSFPDKSPGLAAVLRLARSRELPSLYDPDGMSFAETSPIYLDHFGIEIGRVLVVSRTGDRFEALGWVHPNFADAARECGHVSPGLWIDSGEIAQFGGSDVLRVSDSTFIELSATAEPAREGTTLEVSRPRPVPDPDWAALLTSESAFEASEFGPFRLARRTL